MFYVRVNKRYCIQRYPIYDTLYIYTHAHTHFYYIYKNTVKYVFRSVFTPVPYLHTHTLSHKHCRGDGGCVRRGEPIPLPAGSAAGFPQRRSLLPRAGQHKPLGGDPFLEGPRRLWRRGATLSLVLFYPFSGVGELRAGGSRVVLFCFIFL